MPPVLLPARHVYMRELSKKQHGLPLWKPEPLDQRVRAGPREPQVGDVAYIDPETGTFRRLFNASKSHEDPINDGQVPDGFVPIVLNSQLFSTEDEHLKGGPYMYGSGRRYEGQAAINLSSSTPGIGFNFSVASNSRSAAVLVIKPCGDLYHTLQREVVKKYCIAHAESWGAFAADLGLGISPDDIFFVYGVITTATWALAAFTESDSQAGANISLNAGCLTGPGVSLNGAWNEDTSVEHRSGPRTYSGASNMAPKLPSAGTEASQNPSKRRFDQTVFIRQYKVKRRKFLGMKIRGAAEPKDNDVFRDPDTIPEHAITEDSDESVSDIDSTGSAPYSVISYSTTGKATPRTPLDIFLEYILEKSPEANMAVACDDDVSDIIPEATFPTDFNVALVNISPRLELVNDVGMMAMTMPKPPVQNSSIDLLFYHLGKVFGDTFASPAYDTFASPAYDTFTSPAYDPFAMQSRKSATFAGPQSMWNFPPAQRAQYHDSALGDTFASPYDPFTMQNPAHIHGQPGLPHHVSYGPGITTNGPQHWLSPMDVPGTQIRRAASYGGHRQVRSLNFGAGPSAPGLLSPGMARQTLSMGSERLPSIRDINLGLTTQPVTGHVSSFDHSSPSSVQNTSPRMVFNSFETLSFERQSLSPPHESSSPPQLLIPDTSPATFNFPVINAPEGEGGMMGPSLNIVPATPVDGGASAANASSDGLRSDASASSDWSTLNASEDQPMTFTFPPTSSDWSTTPRLSHNASEDQPMTLKSKSGMSLPGAGPSAPDLLSPRMAHQTFSMGGERLPSIRHLRRPYANRGVGAAYLEPQFSGGLGGQRRSPYPSPHASPRGYEPPEPGFEMDEVNGLRASLGGAGMDMGGMRLVGPQDFDLMPGMGYNSPQTQHNMGGSSGVEGVSEVNVTTRATRDASEKRRKVDATFMCPVPGCGSTFTRHFNLKGHMRSHNEEKPFKCKWPGCQKSFAHQHDCKQHENLHLNVRPFTCEGCHKTFARMDALNRHLHSEDGAQC